MRLSWLTLLSCTSLFAATPNSPSNFAIDGVLAPPKMSLITDTRIISIPSTGTYPAKNNQIVDPVTKFVVTRVSDKAELTGDYNGATSSQSNIVYSRFSPANSTGEFYVVHGNNSTSAWLYRKSDNSNLGPIRFKAALGTGSRVLGEVNEIRWDYSGSHPYRFYFVGRSISSSQAVSTENVGMSFYYMEFNPTTGVMNSPVLIRDFSSDFPTAIGGEIMNDVEGDSSNNSRYWAWMVMNTSLGSGYSPYAIFTYDKDTNKILGKLARSCVGVQAPCTVIDSPATTAPYITRPNMVEMSPLGTRVIVDWERAYTGWYTANIGTTADGPKAFLPNFSDPIRIGADATHSGWAWGPNGEEMFVSQNNRNDWIEAVDIANATTAKCVVISGNSYSCGVKLVTQPSLDGNTYSLGFHFGKVYDPAKKGWVYMNTYASDYLAWGKNQNLLIKINGGTVVRLGSTYNQYFDYRSEGSGALDFKGENIWATGNWGFVDGRGDAFKTTLPTNFWLSLP